MSLTEGRPSVDASDVRKSPAAPRAQNSDLEGGGQRPLHFPVGISSCCGRRMVMDELPHVIGRAVPSKLQIDGR